VRSCTVTDGRLYNSPSRSLRHHGMFWPWVIHSSVDGRPTPSIIVRHHYYVDPRRQNGKSCSQSLWHPRFRVSCRRSVLISSIPLAICKGAAPRSNDEDEAIILSTQRRSSIIPVIIPSRMLSLHFASSQERPHYTTSPAVIATMDRLAWTECVKRSRRSQTDLIDQEYIDPRIERHMMLLAHGAMPTAMATTTTAMDESKNTTPVALKSSHQAHLTERRRVSGRRPAQVDNKTKNDDSEGTEQPIDRHRGPKRKEATQSSDDTRPPIPSSLPELVRVTTSMVLNDQESIWKRIQLMRQAHVPPPANHQKRRFIQDVTSESSLDAVELRSSSQLEQEIIRSSTGVGNNNNDQMSPNCRRVASCPVCDSSALLSVDDDAIFHCHVCGAFASSELMRSLAHQDCEEH
jgi:hypothetical protein